MPREWANYIADQEMLAHKYAEATPTPPNTIREWAEAVEKAVDQTIRHQHEADPILSPTPSLPKACLGRCVPRKLIKKPLAVAIKSARAGDYAPQREPCSVKTRQWTKQIRRIQSLRRRMQHRQLHPESTVSYMPQYWQEWKAITNSPLYDKGFDQWAKQQPELHTVSSTLPCADALYDLEQYTIFATEALIEHEHRKERDAARIAQIYDKQQGGYRQMHRAIRAMSQPRVTTLWQDQEDAGIYVPADDTQKKGIIYVEDGGKYHARQWCTFNGQPAWIEQATPHHLQVELSQPTPGEEGTVTQRSCEMQPLKVATILHDHWDQYWMRDHPDNDFEDAAWTEFLPYLRNIPAYPEIPSHPLTQEEFQAAINDTKATAARGIDGFSAQELCLLPPRAVAHALTLINTDGFPSYMEVARTVPFPKTQQPHQGQVRPITILAMLYRVYMRAISKRAMQTLSKSLPEQITGMVAGPTRGAQISAYATQRYIEQHRERDLPLGGLILDLKKCFNLIPRHPARHILAKLGLPKQWIDTWWQGLTTLTRVWEIDGHISEGRPTTTGVPEGCPISVLVMLGIGTVWAQKAPQQRARATAYADNWGWAAREIETHSAMLQHTVSFTKATRLEIDWHKTTWWTTQPDSEAAWRQLILRHCPHAGLKHQIRHVQDLGCLLTFRNHACAKFQEKRFEKAEEKLEKLERTDFDLPTRIHLVRNDIMPTAMFGAEVYSHATREAYIAHFRAKIARALLGGPHAGNAALLLAFLHEHTIDPAVTYTVQALVAARHFVMHATEEDRGLFYADAAKHRTKIQSVWGPAAILEAHWLADRCTGPNTCRHMALHPA